MNKLPTLGIDIGRVIIEGDGPDTSFLGADDAAAMRAPAIAGAFEAIARLVDVFDRRVFLVSKCGPRIEERSRRWLALHGFFATTGVDPGRLHFCRARRDKAEIAARLGLTAFVDDRRDVLAAMTGIVPVRVHFGADESDVGFAAATWREAEAIILRTLPPEIEGIVAGPPR